MSMQGSDGRQTVQNAETGDRASLHPDGSGLPGSKRKNDLILILALLAGSLLYLGLRRFSPGRAGAAAADTREVAISVDGEEVWRGPFSPADGRLRIEGVSGGYNVFVMETDGSGRTGLRCVEADCPDKICVQTGLVTVTDEPVVCLPHRVTAHIVE